MSQSVLDCALLGLDTLSPPSQLCAVKVTGQSTARDLQAVETLDKERNNFF